MKAREKRKSIAEETLEIIKKGYFVSPEGGRFDISGLQKVAELDVICYAPEETDEMLEQRASVASYTTMVEVTGETTLNAVRRLVDIGKENVLCLNFASARNPGGGFLGGSQAQEESIARATGLYPTLLKAEDYYTTNRNVKSCFYTDYMIYSPKVPLFKKENGENESKIRTCSVITAPAVNTGVVRQREPQRMDEIEVVMKRRINKVLAIAEKHGYSNIVLGAWGCGVFQNDPKDIASYFYEVINSKYSKTFEQIVFAIYAKDERFRKPFENLFA